MSKIDDKIQLRQNKEKRLHFNLQHKMVDNQRFVSVQYLA